MKRLTKFMVIGVFVISFLSLFPQKISLTAGRVYCVVEFRMENQYRHCYADDLEAECGILHPAPFGNWGVDSNVYPRYDGDQFQGWAWREGHYEWNSCTKKDPWKPPDQTCYTYYNAAEDAQGCWEQHSPEGSLGVNAYALLYRRYEIPYYAWKEG